MFYSLFLSVNLTWVYKNSESNNFENIKGVGEIPVNWLNGLFGTNIYKIL